MDYKKTACLVWPVVGTDIPDAHVTVIFLGEIVGVSGSFLKTISALSVVGHFAPGETPVIGPAVFGPPEKPVCVAVLEENGLVDYFDHVEDVLSGYGIENASSFPDFRPHVTLGPKSEHSASSILKYSSFYLDYPELWWGGHKLPLGQLGI